MQMQMKNWVTNNRSMRIFVSMKMILFDTKRWATANAILDFTGVLDL